MIIGRSSRIGGALLILSAVIFAPAQHKTPVRRSGELNRFYHALEHAYADEKGKKGGIGPFKITEEVWRQAFPPGRYEDCEDREYSLQVLERWWGRYYPAALKARDFEVLARTAYAGRYGDKDPDIFWFWRKVQRSMPFEPPTP